MAMGVAWRGNSFGWRQTAPDQYLREHLANVQHRRGRALPEGYESEWNPQLTAWLATLSACVDTPLILLIDYGYEARDYYHEQRARGTLICSYRHRQHDDPFVFVGLQDISASVDFSAVAQAAEASALRVAGYTRQSYFLFGCGLQQMVNEIDPEAGVEYLNLSRQIKLLTLPSEMGERFKAMALSKEWDEPLLGFSVLDERERL